MALPNKIVDINTATWSDHKNQSHGGAQRVTFYADTADNATFYNLGDTAQYVGITAGYTGQSGHKLLRVRCYLQRVGSPSGNLSVQVYPQLTGFTPARPDFTTLLATSIIVPASSVPTSGKNEVVFSFLMPPTLPTPDTTAFAIVLTISTQGNSTNYIKVYRGINGDPGGSQPFSSSTWTIDGSGLSLSKTVEISKSGARVIVLDKTNNLTKPYKTDDSNGATWSAEGTWPLPSTANIKSINTQAGINDLGTTYLAIPDSAAGSLAILKRTESVTTFDPNASVSTVYNANVAGVAPLFGGRRANGTAILLHQGATETVMGSGRRRIKLEFYNGSVWSSAFDVAGSTNTPNSTLPGDAADYDLRWAALDPNGDFHILYTKSDVSTIQYRKFTSANVFTTINTLNGAVAAAANNYPIGQGTFIYKAPDWYIAVPYVDNSSSTLKEARCKTTTSETSTNWVLTQIVAASAEQTGSNPAVLMADNGQGGKVFCWRVVPTTKGLKFTNDSGSSTWAAETDWKGGTQVVAGISGFYVEDGIALVYLEEGTTPDEVRYDRL